MFTRLSIISICLMSLAACDRFENNMNTLGHNTRRGYDKTRYKISDYLYARDKASPIPEPTYQAAQTAYCYKLLTDTVCYDQPVARLRSQMVGMQSDGGYGNLASSASYTNEYSTSSADAYVAPVSSHSTYFDETARNDGHPETNSAGPLTSVDVGSAPGVAGAEDAGSPRSLMGN